MKIAITGSTSILGTYLSKFLKKKGEKVLNINRKKKFLLENTKTFNFKKKNVDALIHLAHSYKANGRKVNYEGTKRLFSNAKKNKIKVNRPLGIVGVRLKPEVSKFPYT